jgi:hypothetical protein
MAPTALALCKKARIVGIPWLAMRNKQSALSAGNPPNLRKLRTVRFEHEAEVAFKGLLLQDAKDGFVP